MSSQLLVVVAIVAALLLLLAVGVAIAAVVRTRRQADVEHRPLDPSVIQCFPPGHPRAGEPIPTAERAPSPSPAERDDPRA